MKKQAIMILAIALILAITLAIVTSGLLSNLEKASTSGVSTSVGTGAFIDQNAAVNCTKIDWGILCAGGTSTQTIYVKNLGTAAETLHFRSSEWKPPNAGSIVTFSCDKEGFMLPEGSIVKVTLTLAVSADIGDVSDFSFNIIIDSSA